jgi:hypothetical protein
MSAAARLVVRELLRKDAAPQLARSFRTSSVPKSHYVSLGVVSTRIGLMPQPLGRCAGDTGQETRHWLAGTMSGSV